MKILIADDHSIVRRGLVQIIKEIDLVNEIDEAADGNEVLNKFQNKQYDIIILDLSMPGMNGLELLDIIKRKNKNQQVLILSTYSEDLYAVRSLKAGASGYLSKAAAPQELITAIRKISTGQKYISNTVAEKLAVEVQEPDKRLSHEKLSEREFEVFKLLAAGNKLNQIAERLNLSEKTISTYRARILEKMNLKDNHDLIHYAYHNKLMDDVL